MDTLLITPGTMPASISVGLPRKAKSVATRKCLKCNNPYTDNGTQFCSPQHRRQYERKTKTCPTPEKKVYDSVEAAWEYINSRPDDKLYKKNLRPYTNCPCRKVHIGHGDK